MATQTQNQRILGKLQQGRTLTSAQARTHGIKSLSARIHELRTSGVNVVSNYVINREGVRVVKYELATSRKTR